VKVNAQVMPVSTVLGLASVMISWTHSIGQKIELGSFTTTSLRTD